jgi:hypothetical protein
VSAAQKRKNSRKPAPEPALVSKHSDVFKPNSDVRVVSYATGAENEDRQALMATTSAQHLTRPDVVSATVIDAYQPGQHDVNALADEVGRQIEAVNRGDLSRAEGLLVAQAHALDRVFATLIIRATQQKLLPQWEVHMRMALRAQNQCRATLETLVALKFPSAVFTHQANINHGGQQQVNNGVTTRPPLAPRVPESEVGPSKLLEADHGQRLDTGAKGARGGADPQMATLGTVDRPENRRGQGKGRAQRVEGGHADRVATAITAAAAIPARARRVQP